VKQLRKFAIAAAAVVLLGACGGGTTVGDEGALGYSATPTPSKTKSKKAKPSVRATKTSTPTQTATQSAPPAGSTKTHQVKTPGFEFDPSDFAARVGDKIVFTNVHDQYEHSFTIRGQEKNYDSGPLNKGEKWTTTVKLAPGTYQFYCTEVSYMVSGSLEVYG